jgi:hypothetical protein
MQLELAYEEEAVFFSEVWILSRVEPQCEAVFVASNLSV